MSLVMEILEGLWNTELYYKGVRVNIFGFPIPYKLKNHTKENSFLSTVSRMKKNGLIEIKNNKWSLTEKGKKYFEYKNRLAIKFRSPFPIHAPKNSLLIFDVPENKRTERNWLRWHLKEFGYHMIQQSVWVGPSPLPKKFTEYAKNIGLDKYIKIFKLSKPYKF